VHFTHQRKKEKTVRRQRRNIEWKKASMPEDMIDGSAMLSLVVNVRTWLQHTKELHLEVLTSDN
jgi:hypothetical protein